MKKLALTCHHRLVTQGFDFVKKKDALKLAQAINYLVIILQ